MLRKTQDIPREISLVLNLFALFVITYIGVDTFYRLLNMQLFQNGDAKVVALKDLALQSDQSVSAPEYSMIVKRNIFGAAETATPASPGAEKVEPVELLEETKLQLSLLGTIAGDTQSARAFILDQRTRKQGLYRVGDSIQDAMIRQILRGKIVLRHSDKDEVLSMVGGEEIATASGKPEQVGMAEERMATSFPLTPLFIERAEQRGRPYRPGRAVEGVASQEKAVEETAAARVAVQNEVPKAKTELEEENSSMASPGNVGSVSPREQAVPDVSAKLPAIASSETMQKVEESAIAPVVLPDFSAVGSSVESWADAWRQKNVAMYLAHYSSEFQPPGGMSRAAWEKQRHERLEKPQFIKIVIREVQQQKVSDTRVQVTFIQEYQSDFYADKVKKTLDLLWEDGSWKIAQEVSRKI
jgi:type II secretory pathway component PulC